MDTHLEAVLVELDEGNCVVEVLGVGGVDGESGNLAVVLAPLYLSLGDFVGYLVGSFADSGFEAVRQLELGQDGVHLGVVLAGFAQHVHYLADGLHALAGPVRHYYRHLHSVGCLDAADLRKVLRAIDGDADVVRHAGTLDDGPGLVAAHCEDADVGPLAALYYLHHFAFPAVLLPALAGHQHLHTIAVQRPAELVLRHENVVVVALHNHESEAVAGQTDCALQLLLALAAAALDAQPRAGLLFPTLFLALIFLLFVEIHFFRHTHYCWGCKT